MSAKHDEIIETISAVLKDLKEHDGKEFYRHDYDKALHVKVAIEQKFNIVRKPHKTCPGCLSPNCQDCRRSQG